MQVVKSHHTSKLHVRYNVLASSKTKWISWLILSTTSPTVVLVLERERGLAHHDLKSQLVPIGVIGVSCLANLIRSSLRSCAILRAYSSRRIFTTTIKAAIIYRTRDSRLSSLEMNAIYKLGGNASLTPLGKSRARAATRDASPRNSVKLGTECT